MGMKMSAPSNGIKPWVSSFIVFTNAFVERSPRIKGITVRKKKFLIRICDK